MKHADAIDRTRLSYKINQALDLRLYRGLSVGSLSLDYDQLTGTMFIQETFVKFTLTKHRKLKAIVRVI